METVIQEWLKTRIRLREFKGIECFYLHSEYKADVLDDPDKVYRCDES